MYLKLSFVANFGLLRLIAQNKTKKNPENIEIE